MANTGDSPYVYVEEEVEDPIFGAKLIRFVGDRDHQPRTFNIVMYKTNEVGAPIYLVDADGSVIPWSAIRKMERLLG